MRPTDELIQRAKQTDLLAVAQGMGLPLKREGRYWRIPGHSGLLLYRKNGNWVWCQMSEERGGDAISFLTSSPVSEMPFREAVELLAGQAWPGSTHDPRPVAVHGGYRGLQGKKTTSSSLKPSPTPQAPCHDEALWRSKALAFCKWCHDQLMAPGGAQMREWLRAKRGLTEATIKRFGLGWNPRRFYRAKRDWGLDEDKKMCLPEGLVIPRFDHGLLTGVTIRRTDQQGAERFGRYHSVPSPFGRGIWTLCQEPGPGDPRTRDQGWPLVIVEGELDAILLAQETDAINLAALGSAGRKPRDLERHKTFCESFTTAPVVFLALDNDEAGRKALGWWMDWQHALPLSVPGGYKDPTEAHLAGFDLRRWLYTAFEEAEVKGYPRFSLGMDTIKMTKGG